MSIPSPKYDIGKTKSPGLFSTVLNLRERDRETEREKERERDRERERERELAKAHRSIITLSRKFSYLLDCVICHRNCGSVGKSVSEIIAKRIDKRVYLSL